MSTLEQDRRDILKVHKDWWEANTGLRIPLMASCFPSGMNYLMYNLQGHPYFGIEEKIKLWEFYAKELEIPEYSDFRIMKMEISGDMAWLATEGIFPIRKIGAAGSAAEMLQVKEDLVPFPVRSTEIFQRNDGEGNPIWKMWHFHCSPMPPEDEPRPGLGGTRKERGLAGNPWGEPLRVVGK